MLRCQGKIIAALAYGFTLGKGGQCKTLLLACDVGIRTLR